MNMLSYLITQLVRVTWFTSIQSTIIVSFKKYFIWYFLIFWYFDIKLNYNFILRIYWGIYKLSGKL